MNKKTEANTETYAVGDNRLVDEACSVSTMIPFDPIYLAQRLARDGHLRLSGSTYLQECHADDLNRLQASYFRLPADTDGGGRYRAYSKASYDKGRLDFASTTVPYEQSAEYNYVDGGKKRLFAPIEPEIINLPLVRSMIATNIEIAKATNLVSFSGPVEVGLHAVRYRSVVGAPSFASPAGLHRDQEEIVWVSLVNMSANAIGGDSVVATSPNSFEAVFRMEHPMETMVVDRSKFHAVTPVGLSSGLCAYRDILIMTLVPTAQMKSSKAA
jgi:L-isoleucine 4-hydroxylase